MCGVVAISSPEGRRFDVAAALDAIRHRGPDDSGVYESKRGDCHLGHVRLSIIDLSSAGHQPMWDWSGRFAIAYNGEVYNFRELRDELDAAHGQLKWRSTSDTEVIVNGFALEGPAFLGKLNGIFALALYDSETRVLYALRDPLGVKPLFVTEVAGATLLCSELKGLMAFPEVGRTIRRESVAAQLSYMYVPEPHTLIDSVLKVEPGVLLAYREGRRVSAQPLYEHLQTPVSLPNDGEWLERFRASLVAAVRRQLVSDAPLSIMLSGGLDSSAIASLAVEGGAQVKTAYTIAVSSADLARDGQEGDLAFARLMADKLGLALEVIPAERNFLDLLPGLAGFLEDGIADPAAINTYLICRAARDHGVKVMLTGQGADEFLGGYRRYVAYAMMVRIDPIRAAMLRAMAAMLPAAVPGRFNASVRRLRRFGKLLGQSAEERLIGLYTWADSALIGRLFRDPPAETASRRMIELFESQRQAGDIEAMMRVDHRFDLMSLNLTYCDRMSMAASVEARVPFLDFDLVRLMNSIPERLKVRGREGKFILKKVMETVLPRSVIYREKSGFGLPLRSWLRHEPELVREYLDAGKIERQGLFNAEVVREICDAQYAGAADHANLIFSMLCFQVWADRSGYGAHP